MKKIFYVLAAMIVLASVSSCGGRTAKSADCCGDVDSTAVVCDSTVVATDTVVVAE